MVGPRASMLDDERYPIAVNTDGIPAGGPFPPPQRLPPHFPLPPPPGVSSPVSPASATRLQAIPPPAVPRPVAPRVVVPQHIGPPPPIPWSIGPPPAIPQRPQRPDVPLHVVQSPTANNQISGNWQYTESNYTASPTSPTCSYELGSPLKLARTVTTSSTLETMYKGEPPIYKAGEGPWKEPAFESKLLRVRKPQRSFWRQFNVWKVLVFGFLAFVTGVVITAVVLNHQMKYAKAAAATATVTGAATGTTTGTATGDAPGDAQGATQGATPGTTTQGATPGATPGTITGTVPVTPPDDGTNATSAQNSSEVSMASSGCWLKDGATWNSQVYYIPANSNSIMYRMNLGNGPAGSEPLETARNMSLNHLPKIGSPLAATANIDSSGVVFLEVFYIVPGNKIAQARLVCASGSADCKTSSNDIITKGAPTLHESSGLGVASINHSQDWRVYYHNAKSKIVQLVGNATGYDRGQFIYDGTTLAGSDLTVVNVDSTMNNLNVFFVDASSQNLYFTQYTDSWQTAKPVSTAAINYWNPISRLTSVFVPVQDMIRVYYVGTDSSVWEFSGYNASSTNTIWEPKPATATTWIKSDNSTDDITAIAYDDQVRWWQYLRTGLVEAALNTSLWVENRVS